MKKPKLKPHSAAEEARINAGIAADPDNPEMTDDMFAKAKRGRPALPEDQKRKPVTIKLDPRIIAHFKGDEPKGWQTRINDTLLKAIGEK